MPCRRSSEFAESGVGNYKKGRKQANIVGNHFSG